MALLEVVKRETLILEHQEQKISTHIKELEDELMSIRKKLIYLTSIEAEAKGDLEPLHGIPFTKKNARVHRAWMSVQYAFRKQTNNSGLHAKDLEKTMLDFIPDLKSPTFRAYLHRFKKDSLIERKSSGRWVLKKSQTASVSGHYKNEPT
ncbi:MAG: hypothetical protein COB46_12330 [Rhodospirillaceae bacterium]|nr:MAG: hypothetical protein COB46_12330 [Rhodospirillaceae bacterium]